MAWTFNRDDMVDFALRICGRVDTDSSGSNDDKNRAADAINMAIEDLNNNGIALMQVSEDSISTSSASNTLDADIEDILKVWVEESSNDHEPFMRFLTRNEYYNIADKETTGTPYECFVDYSNPRKLILWPVPSEAMTIKFLKVTKISSLDSASSTVDYEKRYYAALVYKTAEILSDVFTLPLQERGWIRSQADKKIKAARGREIRSHSRNTLSGAY